jgi:hypothetical protein
VSRALRDDGSPFAATVKRIDPSPWPLGSGCSATHGASLATVQTHSRSTVMRRTPPPPFGGKAVASAAASTLQRVWEGATNVLEDSEPHATGITTHASAQSSRSQRSGP